MKPLHGPRNPRAIHRFARQRWRAWIETAARCASRAPMRRFARQRWRAWIETPRPPAAPSCAGCGSPVSDGGRGLKQLTQRTQHSRPLGSPVSDGGRGLKRLHPCAIASGPRGSPVSDGGRGLKHLPASFASALGRGSPVSDGGRGLKQRQGAAWCVRALGFARQRWRAWIETCFACIICSSTCRFARQRWRAWIETISDRFRPAKGGGSPVSDGGRGLKLRRAASLALPLGVRPSAMAGVD